MNNTITTFYFSPTGTTAKVTKEIANGIGNVTAEYDLTLPQNRNQNTKFTFASDDLVVIGVPVYAGRIPQPLVDYFSKFKGNDTKAVFTVVYGNRDYDDALLELKDIFENNGFISIAAAAFIGEHSYTAKVANERPDAADLNKALSFGLEIKSKLNNPHDHDHNNQLIVKGKYPYKEGIARPPMVPETAENCIGCGICMKHCPMDAINHLNFKSVDVSKCIRCCSCIKKCPVGAKAIHHELFNQITQTLIDNFSLVRREPELFI